MSGRLPRPDRDPSLSVTDTGRGHTLIHCQKGWHPADVMAALGRGMADLWDEPRAEKRESLVAARYIYTDANGKPLFEKVRYFPKRFKVEPSGVTAKLDQVPLSRLPELLLAVNSGRRVWIVEGERDVERLARQGEVATCNYDGASEGKDKPKWRPEGTTANTSEAPTSPSSRTGIAPDSRMPRRSVPT
jgi:putative DNA primase/helicase